MDCSVYVEKLTAFSATLRREGLAVGLQETADACRILEELPMDRRETVRAALSAVYAKSHQEQLIFDRVFRSFFLSVEQQRARREKAEEEARELAQRRAQAEEELQVDGQPMDLGEDLREAYVHMDEEKKEHLRQFLERSEGPRKRSPKLYDGFIRSVFMRYLLEQQMLMEDAALEGREVDPDMALLYRDISRFQDAEIPRAAALIAQITQQINAELSRRRQRSGHSGQLDFKRTIRKGLETGGALCRLSFRRRHKRRRRLVLLCDVSGSMLQFSEFALRFIKSMADVSESSRTFLFSEGVEEVDAFALQDMESFRGYVRETGLFGKGTDLGSALERLCAMRPQVLGPATTLLILSDTKTIDLPRAIRALEAAKSRAGKVLWLNPIPQPKWSYIHSVDTMSQLCPMVPCSTLHDLARACRRLVQG